MNSLKLENPPLVETAISIQFQPIVGFTSGHFGWYWKDSLDSSWVKTIEAPILPDQFERFGDPQARISLTSLQFNLANQPDRLQIVNAADDRVIQIQNSRFIYNWRKREDVYPSFKSIYPEFVAKVSDFRAFLKKAGLDPIIPNQWEIIYINYLQKGDLWQKTEDWSNVLPGLFPSPLRTDLVQFESGSAEWQFEISPKKGRLRVSAQHGMTGPLGTEVLVLQLTARGGVEIGSESMEGFDLGLNLGHQVLVDTFSKIVSQEALARWGAK
jgi:uncharacterized protein (TIGR04255 family)